VTLPGVYAPASISLQVIGAHTPPLHVLEEDTEKIFIQEAEETNPVRISYSTTGKRVECRFYPEYQNNNFDYSKSVITKEQIDLTLHAAPTEGEVEAMTSTNYISIPAFSSYFN
jgi:hypothetical protein